VGCDIHGPVIYSDSSSYVCEEVVLHWDRDYLCFAIIADVRNDGDVPTVVPNTPRGLPENLAERGAWRYLDQTTCADCEAEHVGSHSPDNADCHSHSWLTTEELIEAQKLYKKYNDSHEASADIALTIIIMRMLEQRGRQSLRLVFCFDN
jgi:hypothetical protein